MGVYMYIMCHGQCDTYSTSPVVFLNIKCTHKPEVKFLWENPFAPVLDILFICGFVATAESRECIAGPRYCFKIMHKLQNSDDNMGMLLFIVIII